MILIFFFHIREVINSFPVHRTCQRLVIIIYKALRDGQFFWLGPIKETKNQMEQVIIMVLRATLTSQQMLRWFCVNGKKKFEHIKDKDFASQVIALHKWRIASIINVKASLSYLIFILFFYFLVSKHIFYCKETTSCTRETKKSKDFIIPLHFYIHTRLVWLDLLYLFSLNFEKPFLHELY